MKKGYFLLAGLVILALMSWGCHPGPKTSPSSMPLPSLTEIQPSTTPLPLSTTESALNTLEPISTATSVNAGPAVWNSVGPEGGLIQALAIDPKTPDTLYAGTTFGGVFKSTARAI